MTSPVFPQHSHPEPSSWKRPWVFLVATAVVALAVGAGVGRASKDTHESALDTANTQIAQLQSQLTQAQSDAANALTAAKAQVEAEDQATRVKLGAQRAALVERAQSLDARERKVTGEERSYARNTVPGDGEYVVGKDIRPGIYHSSGGSSCYWARLRSYDTSDIIDNNISAGPQNVQIYSTDRVFYTENCGDWHKVG